MIQLIVNNEQIDLFESEVFALDKAISNIGRINTRSGDKSIGFKVPLTDKNNRIFQYITQLNQVQSFQNKRFEGEIRQDDAILSKGFFQITSANPIKKELSLRFYGGNSSWFDLLKDKLVSDLDFSEFDHTKTKATVSASWTNTDGYHYFLFDDGRNSGKTDDVTELVDWKLSYFEHTIFSKIFEAVGIKTKGTLFNEPLFYLTSLPTTQTDVEYNSNGSLPFEFYDYTSPQQLPYNDEAGSPDPVQYDDITNEDTGFWDGSKWTCPENMDIDFNFFNDITRIGLGDEVRTFVSINGAPNVLINTSTNDDDDVYVYSGSFLLGDTIEFFMDFNVPSVTLFPKPIVTTNSYIDIVTSNIGFNITNALPKVKQIDFIKDIMFRYAVVSQFNESTNELTLNRFEDINSNKSDSIDWSDKIDLSFDPVFDFTRIVSDYNKQSLFIYKDDDKDLDAILWKNITTVGYGNGILTIDNDFLNDRGDVYESPYSATVTRNTWDYYGITRYLLPHIPDFVPDADNSNFTRNVTNQRIVINNGLTNVSDINNAGVTEIGIDDGGITLYNQIGYAYFDKPLFENSPINQDRDSLGYDKPYGVGGRVSKEFNGLGLIDRYFSVYKSILNDPVYLSMRFNLNNLDIQDLDFLVPRWLDFGLNTGYYYIDNISQYKGDGSTTRVNLVKI